MKRRSLVWPWWLAIGLGEMTESVFAQVEEVRLSRFPKSANQFVAAQILSEIYRRCGLLAKVESMPPSRAPLELLSGRLDGEVSRLKTHLELHPGLIRVSPAFDYFTMTAFSRLPVAIRSKEDLRKYSVGIIRGVQAAINQTAGMEGVEMAPNSESLFLMLAAGRIDVAIDVDINGAFEIAKLRLKGIRPVGDIYREDVFHYLAPHKAYLRSRISEKIAEMKGTGELQRLKQNFNREFLAKGLAPD